MSRDRVAQRLYMRQYRASKTTEGVTASVTGLHGEDVTPPADRVSVAAAVAAEIELLHDHGTVRPGLAAAALRLAELLDDPSAVPQHPAAAGRLRDLLDELHRTQERAAGTSRLDQIRMGVRRQA